MNLEQQVCSLELAKRLKELGVKQVSLFAWVGKRLQYGSLDDCHPCNWESYCGHYRFEVWASAFTVAELGERLSERVHKKAEDYYLMLWKGNNIWFLNYRYYDIGTLTDIYLVKESIFADTEADARAKMLICLLENGLV